VRGTKGLVGCEVSTEKATDLREELRAAVAHQEKNGGESVMIPAREMLADMLMELKRSSDALAEYKVVLKNAPNRFDTLLGAGRAAQASGDTNGAQAFYAKLTEVCQREPTGRNWRKQKQFWRRNKGRPPGWRYGPLYHLCDLCDLCDCVTGAIARRIPGR
jgi:hypothetical protein